MIRIGKRSVVTYEQDGTHYACPPRNGRPYIVRVHDYKRYEQLARSGWLYSTAHVGPKGKMQDARKTS